MAQPVQLLKHWDNKKMGMFSINRNFKVPNKILFLYWRMVTDPHGEDEKKWLAVDPEADKKAG